MKWHDAASRRGVNGLNEMREKMRGSAHSRSPGKMISSPFCPSLPKAPLSFWKVLGESVGSTGGRGHRRPRPLGVGERVSEAGILAPVRVLLSPQAVSRLRPSLPEAGTVVTDGPAQLGAGGSGGRSRARRAAGPRTSGGGPGPQRPGSVLSPVTRVTSESHRGRSADPPSSAGVRT